MKNTDETPELSYHLIQQAVSGESKAVEKILHIYDKYINSVVMFETTDMNGNTIKTMAVQKASRRNQKYRYADFRAVHQYYLSQAKH